MGTDEEGLHKYRCRRDTGKLYNNYYCYTGRATNLTKDQNARSNVLV